MSNETNEKNKRIIIILLSVGIVACIAVTIWAVFFRKPESEPPLVPDYAPAQTEPNAEPVTDDGGKLDVPSGGGGISIEYENTVTVDLSDNKATFQYTHPAKSTQNILLQIVVQDTVIAQSGLITPGHKLRELTLLDGAAKKLTAGVYTDAQFKILSYHPESGEKAMVDTVAEITVTVKE